MHAKTQKMFHRNKQNQIARASVRGTKVDEVVFSAIEIAKKKEMIRQYEMQDTVMRLKRTLRRIYVITKFAKMCGIFLTPKDCDLKKIHAMKKQQNLDEKRKQLQMESWDQK